MKHNNAQLRLVAECAARGSEGLSNAKRIQLYVALGNLLPEGEERQKAQLTAFTLTQAEEQHRDFLHLLQTNPKPEGQ